MIQDFNGRKPCLQQRFRFVLYGKGRIIMIKFAVTDPLFCLQRDQVLTVHLFFLFGKGEVIRQYKITVFL